MGPGAAGAGDGVGGGDGQVSDGNRHRPVAHKRGLPR